MTTWCKEMFTCERYVRKNGFLVVIWKCEKDNIPIIVVNMHFAYEYKEKMKLWDELFII